MPTRRNARCRLRALVRKAGLADGRAGYRNADKSSQPLTSYPIYIQPTPPTDARFSKHSALFGRLAHHADGRCCNHIRARGRSTRQTRIAQNRSDSCPCMSFVILSAFAYSRPKAAIQQPTPKPVIRISDRPCRNRPPTSPPRSPRKLQCPGEFAKPALAQGDGIFICAPQLDLPVLFEVGGAP